MLLLFGASVSAATFLVDSTADSIDTAPGNGVCADAAGFCTLRAAVMESNALSGADAIDVPAGTYVRSIAGTGENGAATGDLDVTDSLTITGAGSGATIVDASGIDRVLHVLLFSFSQAVTVRDLTLSGGEGGADDYSFFGGGGALLAIGFSNEPVTLERVVMIDNHATGDGGAVHCYDASCVIRESELRDNGATNLGSAFAWAYGSHRIEDSLVTANVGGGAALAHEVAITGGALLVERSSVSGNLGNGVSMADTALEIRDSLVEGNQGAGLVAGEGGTQITRTTIRGNTQGGIRYVNFGSGFLRLDASSIVGNASAADGGGLYVYSDLEARIRNSTISGNETTQRGGGVFLSASFPWSISIENTTITANTAAEGGGVAAFSSGSPPSPLAIRNTVIAGNTAAAGPDCFELGGLLASGGYDLVGDATDCDWVAATGDQLGTSGAPIDPLLGPLVAFGNGTFGHKPQPGSPLLDLGNPAAPGSGGAACLATDQRGQSRPQNGDGVPGARCDIGAVEKRPSSGGCGLGAELALVFGALARRRRPRRHQRSGAKRGIVVA